jgi:tetraacyldisaccharide-1-P 4'-kinase
LKISKTFDDPYHIFLTTEKDAVRLAMHYEILMKNQVKFYVLPISVVFLDYDTEKFDAEIKTRLLEIEK